MRLYHYTKGVHIPEILSSGLLLPTRLGIPKHERPILWFSSNSVWEVTVSMHLGKAETERLGEGLYRIGIGVNVPAKPWNQLRFLAHIDPREADRIEQSARRAGANPDEWYGTFHPVPRTNWAGIERLIEGQWRLV